MFQRKVFLHSHSNYKIGGPAAYFFEPKTTQETVDAIKKWQDVAKSFPVKRQKVFTLGGGTNILFGDSGFPGLILKLKLSSLKRKGNHIVAGTGVPMSDLLDFAIKHGLGGLEWSGGLPGFLGGAIRGNAGCFGGEIKDVVSSVKSLTYEGKVPKIVTRKNAECEFAYRDSIFKRNKEIILEVTLTLKKADKKVLKKVAEEKRTYRQERHPLEYPNIGSIFKNVPLKQMMKAKKLTEAEARAQFLVKDDPFPVIPTARLISECGLKGKKVGGAMISEKHANFIVNASRARAEDVKKLIKLVKKAVYKRFRVRLEEEVVRL